MILPDEGADVHHLRSRVRGLVTVADYRRLPDVLGVENHPGHGAITIYVAPDLNAAALKWLQAYVREHKPLNLMVAWKTDRRQLERRQR